MKDENMKESIAIVTGASQGIGRATAVRLAKDFSGVVLAARDGKALEENAGEVRATGAESLTAALDLRSREVPNTKDIGLESAGVKLTDDGYVQVNERLETTAPG